MKLLTLTHYLSSITRNEKMERRYVSTFLRSAKAMAIRKKVMDLKHLLHTLQRTKKKENKLRMQPQLTQQIIQKHNLHSPT